MNIAVRESLMTVEEFLDWHPDGENWELIGGIPLRSMSESGLHERVKTNVSGSWIRRLRHPSPCLPGVDGRQVKIDSVTSFRPDFHIDCAFDLALTGLSVEKPTVVFEVADTSLEQYRDRKRAGYFRNPHVEHVVVIDATGRQVLHYRKGSAREIVLREGDILELEGTVSLDIPVAEFFESLPPHG